LSYVDFGINPNVKIWPASKLGNWVQPEELRKRQ